jgi:hypothetical protein
VEGGWGTIQVFDLNLACTYLPIPLPTRVIRNFIVRPWMGGRGAEKGREIGKPLPMRLVGKGERIK